jgi:hypothetical protein
MIEQNVLMIITVLVPAKRRKNCGLSYVYNWVKLFICGYNTKIKNPVPFLNGVNEC